jgi:hypothetical protein
MLMTPSNGKDISGIKEVTGMGTASDTHHVIIHTATAITLLAPGEINVSGSTETTTNNSGPKKNPNWRADGSEFTNTFEFFQNYFF